MFVVIVVVKLCNSCVELVLRFRGSVAKGEINWVGWSGQAAPGSHLGKTCAGSRLFRAFEGYSYHAFVVDFLYYRNDMTILSLCYLRSSHPWIPCRSDFSGGISHLMCPCGRSASKVVDLLL